MRKRAIPTRTTKRITTKKINNEGKSDVTKKVYHREKQHTCVVLHDIRSIENVGAIFRTADAAGVDTILLSGYTPGPMDRFGRPRQAFHKSALGAEKTMSYMSFPSFKDTLSFLKKEGYTVYAIEQAPQALSYRKAISSIADTSKAAFVFGNEVTGLSKKEYSLCHNTLEIPMHGKKESLNVSASCAIALFVLLER